MLPGRRSKFSGFAIFPLRGLRDYGHGPHSASI